MPTFEFDSLTSDGRKTAGTIEADSHSEAQQQLAAMCLCVNSLSECRKPKTFKKVGRDEFLLFNQQLASIAKAGIPLERGLRELAGDVDSPRMRKRINEIATELESGAPIEKAFGARSSGFPELYGQILKAGVQSGQLAEMLTSLNRHVEMGRRAKRMIVEAVTYPAFILVLAAVVMSFCMANMDSVEAMYADMGMAHLPAFTRLILSLGRHVADAWIGVGLFVGACVALAVCLNVTGAGRRFKERLLLKMPVLGRLLQRSLLSRLADGMRLLVGAGCDLPTCLRLSAAATGSGVLQNECEPFARAVEEGDDIASAGRHCRMIPPLFVYSAHIGAQRNELECHLANLSGMYEQQAQGNLARLHSLLMPIMLIIVAAIMTLCIVALLMPLMSLIHSVQG